MSLVRNVGAALGLAGIATGGTYHVTSNADTGAPGTLRWAINMANANPGPDSIVFDSAFEGANAITVDPAFGALPPLIDDGTLVAGDSAPDSDGTPSSPDVEIQVGMAAGTYGIRIDGAANCEVRGLYLVVTAGSGISLLNGAVANAIGNVATRQLNEMKDCVVGVSIVGVGTDGNVVRNNRVHVCQGGVIVDMGPRANQIGGLAPGESNAIYSNGGFGILVRAQIGGVIVPTRQNEIRGNYIGTDSAAAPPLGNGGAGVVLTGIDCDDNVVESNWIVFNANDGIYMLAGAQNRIGPANVISGNAGEGIDDQGGVTSVANEIVGNMVGVDVSGLVPVPNLGSGIAIRNGATMHQVHDNVIAANAQHGILFDGNNPRLINVQSNTIGLNAAGAPMGNGGHGILMGSTSSDMLVDGNTISANGMYGISLGTCQEVSLHHTVVSNRIGTDATGMMALGNQWGGILVVGGESFIGAPGEDDGNLISGNLGWGIEVGGCDPGGNESFLLRIVRNGIGVDAAGGPLANAAGGIWFRDHSHDCWVGDPTDLRNLIRHNGGPGIRIGEAMAAAQPVGIRVVTNSISDNAAEGIKLIDVANNSIPRPVVISASPTGVYGANTLAGSGFDVLVQVFHDTGNEGREFLGEVTVASGDANWVLDVAVPEGAYVTATNTRLIAGDEYETSEFSAAKAALLAIPFCFGDGSGTPCPCESGGPGEGCENSTGAGAVLTATGSNSVADANLVLHGSGLPANKPGLFFQGNNWVGGGNGTPFGDGLLCVGAPIRRLQVRMSNGAGEVATTVNIATAGLVVPPVTRYYQLWYRDPASTCASTPFFNTTNALQIFWRP